MRTENQCLLGCAPCIFRSGDTSLAQGNVSVEKAIQKPGMPELLQVNLRCSETGALNGTSIAMGVTVTTLKHFSTTRAIQVWEFERQTKFDEYDKKNLWESDPKAWGSDLQYDASNNIVNLAGKTFNTFEDAQPPFPPEGTMPCDWSPWHVCTGQSTTDQYGWQYAHSFEDRDWFHEDDSSSWVRRRKWTRTYIGGDIIGIVKRDPVDLPSHCH